MKTSFLLILALTVPAMAACTGSGVTWSCAAGSTTANIQSAISSATDGATITLAAGSYTLGWVKFSNSKGATLICASVGACIINTGGSTVFGGDIFGGTNNFFYRISGFVIDGGNGTPSGLVAFDDYNGSGPVTMSQIRIDHNTFQNMQAGGFAIFFGHNNSTSPNGDPYNEFYGVIDHNTFQNSVQYTALMWIGIINPSPSLIPASQMGTANNMFFEDNTINFTTMPNASNGGCSDGWGGAAYVIRHNTSLNCLWAFHAVTHGGGVANVEFYNNSASVNNGSSGAGVLDGYRLFHHQGSGEITVFNNSFTAFSGKNSEVISVLHYRDYLNSIDGGLPQCDGTQSIDGNRATTATNRGYPCWNQPGRDFKTQTLHPMYTWNNAWSDTHAQVPLVLPDNGGSPDYYANHMQFGREANDAVSASAQSSATSPFNGTTGTGFGTIANRPTTCTTNAEPGAGVGYFATDVGSQGTMYTCQATNTWTVYYTPYTYPHPLTFSKTLTKMVILPPSTGYWIFSAANTGTIQLSLFCTYSDASTDTTCTGAGGTVTWFTENPNALTVNSSGLATGAGAPAWVSTTTYSSGQIVSSGGAIWTALQFTTNETPGTGGSWLKAVGTSIGAYNGTISGHAGIAVSPTALTCVNIRPETTASNITLGSTILLSAEDCSSGDNVGGAAIGNYPAWTSSNTGVATVNNIGEVTATGVGSAVITATLVGITQTRTVTVTNPTILGTTWFVRADGGTIKDTNVPGGQCDATLNVPLAGSTGGHCAVNEIMYCFTDETSSSAYTGIVKGGDTCQVAAPPAGTFYHVAQKSPGTAWVTAALAPGAIAPPSGKPGSPTKLIGAGFATCESADPLHLGTCIPTVSYGAVTLELYDVQNFDVKGIDLWSGVDCIRSASPLFFNCPSGAGAREAIFVDQFTNNFTIENSRIHGYFASIAGTPGPGTVWTNVAVLYNTLTGINFDNPFGYNGNRSDGFSLVNSYIGYAGFAEELPKSLAGGSVNRDGSGHLNVTFPSGSLVNYVPGTNFVVTGNTPSDLNGTFPVTSVNFNQNTANITAVSFRGCNDGFNSVGCADFTTTAAPTFNVGDLVKLTTTSPIPSVLNGPFEVMSINTSPVGFTVAGSIFTRPGWLVSGSFTGTGTASTALSIVATAAGSSESASVLGTASHVIPAHRAMDQQDDTHFSNGDCVGTGNNTIGVWISTGNQFHRCTQDGWDMLHSAMTSSIFTGNYVEGVEGQALKLGDADSAVVKNNFIVSTAGANMAPDSNLPPEYNQYLTTFFRAGDAFLTHNEAFDSMIFTNNTVLNVGQNVTWDDQCDSVIGCQSLPFAQFVFQNNDVIAASDTNNPVFNSSQPTIYFQGQNAPIFTTPAWNPNNNLAFQGRNPPGGSGTGNNWALGACPTIACVANITTFAGESASLQANWNMNLIAGSPAIGAGVNNSFTPATDFNGTTTTVPSVVGAVNLTGTVTPTAQFFGSGNFFGKQTIP